MQICIVYHPSSGHPEELLTIPEYQEQMYANSAISYNSLGMDGLWEPFESEVDFTFTEFICRIYLSQPQVDCLLKLLKNTWSESQKVTFKNHEEVMKALKLAKEKTTQVCIVSCIHSI